MATAGDVIINLKVDDTNARKQLRRLRWYINRRQLAVWAGLFAVNDVVLVSIFLAAR